MATCSVTLGTQYCDISWGLVHGTANKWQFLSESTPGKQNVS